MKLLLPQLLVEFLIHCLLVTIFRLIYFVMNFNRKLIVSSACVYMSSKCSVALL